MNSSPIDVLAAMGAAAWLVGGAVRDRLLGRFTADYDVVTSEDPRPVARSLARNAAGHAFVLSAGFGAWRVVARDRSWQVDLTPLAGETIEADLAKRDFTINAIAERLRDPSQTLGRPQYVDPFCGLRDLRQRRLRMVSASAFTADPLRTLRLARLACELDLGVDPATVAAARASAGDLAGIASERVFAELRRVLSADLALKGVELMDAVGATDVVLPELSLLRGVEQSSYHHLDVYEHTRAVLACTIELERDPRRWFGEHGDAVGALLAEPLANELTRGQALRFGALLHDIAKPQTRRVTAEGRVTFMGHDAAGAEIAGAILERLRASEKLREYVAALVRNHLRLGFLVHETPVSRRAVYRYMRACEPVQVEVSVLSVADRLATRGRGSEEAIERHLTVARQLLADALAWREHPPRPPLRGDELARAVGLPPGPEIGRLLDELEEASFAGEIATRADAIECARGLLGD